MKPCRGCPPGGQSTRNWLTTVNSLRSGCSQSMKWIVWPRPPSDLGRPSTVVPVSRSAVTSWLASISSVRGDREKRRLGLGDAARRRAIVAVVVEVDAPHRGAQVARQDDLAERLPM